MARANGWESFGPLGAASATQHIFSALEALRQQADELRHMIRVGPIGDPWADKDVERLTQFIDNLSVAGLIKRNDTLSFTAVNRDETEHDLLFQDAAINADWLNDFAHYVDDRGMGIQRIGNVFYRVSDMDAAVRFYTDVLGFGLKLRDGDRWAAFDFGGIGIKLARLAEQVEAHIGQRHVLFQHRRMAAPFRQPMP